MGHKTEHNMLESLYVSANMPQLRVGKCGLELAARWNNNWHDRNICLWSEKHGRLSSVQQLMPENSGRVRLGVIQTNTNSARNFQDRLPSYCATLLMWRNMPTNTSIQLRVIKSITTKKWTDESNKNRDKLTNKNANHIPFHQQVTRDWSWQRENPNRPVKLSYFQKKVQAFLMLFFIIPSNRKRMMECTISIVLIVRLVPGSFFKYLFVILMINNMNICQGHQ